MKMKRMITIFSLLVLLAVIIILNSVVFTVKTVHAECRNAVDLAAAAEIETRAESFKGKNIIFLSESKLTADINENIEGVRVVNIERKFPSMLTVHFKKIIPLLGIEYDGQVLTADSDLKTVAPAAAYSEVSFNDTVSQVDGKEETDPPALVRVKIAGSVGVPYPKKDIPIAETQYKLLNRIITTFDGMNMPETDFVRQVSEIDISGAAASDGAVYLKTRRIGDLEEITVKILSPSRSLPEKINHGISFYWACYNKGIEDLRGKSIIVNHDSTGKINTNLSDSLD